MVQYIPPPDPRSLLPPLLACLPTAFVSPRPPPALLPLLSPILRQRVQLLATTSSSSSESWLPLLCWDSELAQELVHLVSESDVFELHPISGEIEIGSIEPVKYRRLDEETLQARIAAPETGLTVIVIWDETDQDGESNAWRIAEVRPIDDLDDVHIGHWCPTMATAEGRAREQAFEEAIREQDAPTSYSNSHTQTSTVTDDDAYWAQYDSTPARTPGASQTTSDAKHPRSASEAEYFQRYAQVQPEMDNDDPSEPRDAIGPSTLDGNAMSSNDAIISRPELGDPLSNISTNDPPMRALSHPTTSPPPPGPAAVSRLEQQAAVLSIADPAVKLHISTSIKSLFRLCRGCGMARKDFEHMVQTELLTLSMIENEEED